MEDRCEKWPLSTLRMSHCLKESDFWGEVGAAASTSLQKSSLFFNVILSNYLAQLVELRAQGIMVNDTIDFMDPLHRFTFLNTCLQMV